MSIVTEVQRRRLHKGSCTHTKIAIWFYFIIFAETDPPDVSFYLFTRAQSQPLSALPARKHYSPVVMAGLGARPLST